VRHRRRTVGLHNPVNKPAVAFAAFGTADGKRLVRPDAKFHQFVAHDRRHGKLKYSPNTVTARLGALRFFYIKVLKRNWSIAETPYPRKVIHPPEILSS